MAEKCKFAKDGAKAGYYFDCLDCPKEKCEEPELRKRFFALWSKNGRGVLIDNI